MKATEETTAATRSSVVKCGHTASGNGFSWTCDHPTGHTDLHGETTQLRDGKSTTNWGDDGLGIWATRGRNLNGHWTMVR